MSLDKKKGDLSPVRAGTRLALTLAAATEWPSIAMFGIHRRHWGDSPPTPAPVKAYSYNFETMQPTNSPTPQG